MAFQKITASENYARISLFSLSPSERDILNYFLTQISSSRVPVRVPLLFPARKLHWPIYKVQYNINKLIKKGILERWTAIHQNKQGTGWQKSSYYRLNLKLLG
jgi:hypothetical protein